MRTAKTITCAVFLFGVAAVGSTIAQAVRINDRGPYAHGRVIDLSRASAQSIGIDGLAQVTLAGL